MITHRASESVYCTTKCRLWFESFDYDEQWAGMDANTFQSNWNGRFKFESNLEMLRRSLLLMYMANGTMSVIISSASLGAVLLTPVMNGHASLWRCSSCFLTVINLSTAKEKLMVIKATALKVDSRLMSFSFRAE